MRGNQGVACVKQEPDIGDPLAYFDPCVTSTPTIEGDKFQLPVGGPSSGSMQPGGPAAFGATSTVDALNLAGAGTGWGTELFDPPGSNDFLCDADLNSLLKEGVDHDTAEIAGWLDSTVGSDSSADGSEQDTVGALRSMPKISTGRAGMPRAISMPNVMLGGLRSAPASPSDAAAPFPVPTSSGPTAPSTSAAAVQHASTAGMHRSMSHSCLLSGRGAGMPSAVLQGPSIVPAGSDPPTAVWHAAVGISPRRKGKGGRQPAMDPRLDPNMDPKKARRIVANRISAAKSKLKQKGEIEMLKARLQELSAQKDLLESQGRTMQAACAGLQAENQALHRKVALMQDVQVVQEALTKKLQAQLDEMRASQGMGGISIGCDGGAMGGGVGAMEC